MNALETITILCSLELQQSYLTFSALYNANFYRFLAIALSVNVNNSVHTSNKAYKYVLKSSVVQLNSVTKYWKTNVMLLTVLLMYSYIRKTTLLLQIFLQ